MSRKIVKKRKNLTDSRTRQNSQPRVHHLRILPRLRQPGRFDDHHRESAIWHGTAHPHLQQRRHFQPNNRQLLNPLPPSRLHNRNRSPEQPKTPRPQSTRRALPSQATFPRPFPPPPRKRNSPPPPRRTMRHLPRTNLHRPYLHHQSTRMSLPALQILHPPNNKPTRCRTRRALHRGEGGGEHL